MPSKKIDPSSVSAGFDSYIEVGPIRIAVESWEGQPEEALSRLISTLDREKAKAARIEVL